MVVLEPFSSLAGAFVTQHLVDRHNIHKEKEMLATLEDFYKTQQQQLADRVTNDEVFRHAPTEIKEKWVDNLIQEQEKQLDAKLTELEKQNPVAFKEIREDRKELREALDSQRDAVKDTIAAEQEKMASIQAEQEKLRQDMAANLEKRGLDADTIAEKLKEQQALFERQQREALEDMYRQAAKEQERTRY